MCKKDKPTCQYCNKNVAHNAGRNKKTGKTIFRKAVDEVDGISKYICDVCRRKRYKKRCSENGTVPGGWIYGHRDGQSAAYRRYKHAEANYCENSDGRLGFECTYEIRNTIQLDVDHILENFSTDDADKNDNDNLQTLCKNCHAMKNYYVMTANIDALYRMLKAAYRKKGFKFNKEELLNRVDRLLENANAHKNEES